jgi:hypothetical protein
VEGLEATIEGLDTRIDELETSLDDVSPFLAQKVTSAATPEAIGAFLA